MICQGVCTDNAPCNKSTGKCDNGCGDHWTGKYCEGTLFIDFEDTFIFEYFSAILIEFWSKFKVNEYMCLII